MSHPCSTCDNRTRRTFLADLGMGFTGLALGSMLHADGVVRAAEKAWSPPDGRHHFPPKAKSVIWVFLSGGYSQLETFDPKPGTDTGGTTQSIATSVPGIQIADTLPQIAKHMRDLTILRNITSNEGDHFRGTYYLHTGFRQVPGFPRPSPNPSSRSSPSAAQASGPALS